MIVTYLDLKTGKIASRKGICSFHLMDGNWSCDCNRGSAFGYDGYFEDWCDGNVRFIAIDVKPEKDLGFDGYTKQEILKEANLGYYYILKKWRDILYHGVTEDERPAFKDQGDHNE